MGFIQAVVARALQDDEYFSVDVGLIFAPAGFEAWEGVSANVELRPAEEKGSDPYVEFTFVAKEGDGEALADEFKKIIDGAKEHLEGNEHFPPHELDAFSVDQDSEETDKIRVTFSPPLPPLAGEEDDRLEEGMAEKPTLSMEIHTGRTFQEMVDNIHECPATLAGGIDVKASTKLAKALVHVANDMGEAGAHEMMPHRYRHDAIDAMRAFDAISSFSSHSDLRYSTEKLEAAVCDPRKSEHQKAMVEKYKSALPRMLAPVIGKDTVRAAAGLTDHADHLHSIRIAGLRQDYEIYVEFENFHLTPVIAEFLQLPDDE